MSKNILEEVPPIREAQRIGRMPVPHRKGELPSNQKQIDEYNRQRELRHKELQLKYIDKKKKEVQKAEKVFSSIRRAQDQLEDQVESNKIIAQAVVNSAKQKGEDDRQKTIDFVHNTKTALDATAAAIELTSSLGTLIRAYGNYKNWQNANRLKRGLINLLNRKTLTLQTAGLAADGYQFITADDTFNKYDNGAELIGGTAGIIGSSDYFRNTPMYGNYGNYIDTALDVVGVGQSAWDIGKYGYNKISPIFNLKSIEDLYKEKLQ